MSWLQELVESYQENSIFHFLECNLLKHTTKCICNNKCINTSEDSMQADLHKLINLEKSINFFPECLARLSVLCLHDSSVLELPSITQIIPLGQFLATFEFSFWPQCRDVHCIPLYDSAFWSSLQILH